MEKIQEFFTVAFSKIKDFFAELQEESLEEILSSLEKHLDRVILEGEKTGLAYVGGKLRLFFITEKNVRVLAELYFQTGEKKWIKKEISGTISSIPSAAWESQALLLDLKVNHELEFPIMKPEDTECGGD